MQAHRDVGGDGYLGESGVGKGGMRGRVIVYLLDFDL